MDPRTRTTIGSRDVEVTRLGLGTAPLGGWPEPVSEADGLATIEAAWTAGLRYFDTAPFYGYGQSERWLGRVLGDLPRAEFTLSTKVGRLLREPAEPEPEFFRGTGTALRAAWDFSRQGTRRSLEESLERLGMDRVDVALMHDADDHLEAAVEGAYVALAELRDEGVLGAIGVGMNFIDPIMYLVERLDLDCVLVAGRYTLLEQPALDGLLPAAVEHGFSVVAGGVFNSGLLVDPRPGATYDYAPAADTVVTRAQRIKAVCDAHEVPLMAAALQFPLAHPGVAAVVTGARTAAELRQNVELLQAPLPAALWDDLRAQGLIDEQVPVPDPVDAA